MWLKLKKKLFIRSKNNATLLVVISVYNYMLHIIYSFSLFVVMLNRTMQKESCRVSHN